MAANPRARWIAVFNVVGRHLPGFRPSTIFDVGANAGDTTENFAARFPEARIHAFEPVPSAFRQLQEAMRSHPRVRCHELALSDRTVSLWMDIPDNTRLARIVPGSGGNPGMIEVRSTTGDAFCADEGLARVDFLKVDTEGHDLDVLRGFEGMLGQQRVGLIDIEVGFLPESERQVPLGTVQAYLDALGYVPFWLHERTLDLYFSGRPMLRRVNMVYVSRELVDANTVEPRSITRLRESAEDGSSP
jgi:FkbM family methyltransferase